MSRSLVRIVTTLLALSAPWLFIPAAHALCTDPAGDCAGIPCPAQYSCHDDADCPPGSSCVYYPGDCWPSHCYCDSGAWVCTGDCHQYQCDVEVPAASERGLLVLALLLVTSGSFVLLRRRRAAS